ncbi:TPA: hypothetical protein ACH3X1_008492 [Trebouxia sp. C0004]
MLLASELTKLADLFASDLKMTDNNEAAEPQDPVPMGETPPVPIVTAEQVNARLNQFSHDAVRQVNSLSQQFVVVNSKLSQVGDVVTALIKASIEQLIPVLASKMDQKLPSTIQTVVAQAVATEVARQEARSAALRAAAPSLEPNPTFSVLPPTPPTTQLYELPDYEPIPNFVDHSQPQGSSGPSTLY